MKKKIESWSFSIPDARAGEGRAGFFRVSTCTRGTTVTRKCPFSLRLERKKRSKHQQAKHDERS